MSQIPRPQAAAFAAFLRTIRPAWDELATINALAALKDRDLADLAYAAIRTAQDPTMRTPAAIAFDTHWRPTVRDVETPAERRARIQAQLDQRAENARLRAERPDITGKAREIGQLIRQPASKETR